MEVSILEPLMFNLLLVTFTLAYREQPTAYFVTESLDHLLVC